jgi:hypothetical protein
MYQMAIEYTKLYHSKALQNLPKLGLLVSKYTLWQPWCVGENRMRERTKQGDAKKVKVLKLAYIHIFCKMLPPFTLAGLNHATHCSSLLGEGRDDTTRLG